MSREEGGKVQIPIRLEYIVPHWQQSGHWVFGVKLQHYLFPAEHCGY